MELLTRLGVCAPQRDTTLLVDAMLAAVVARDRVPFGPVLRERAGWLADRGLVEAGEAEEELVVTRADRIR
ncbi:release factor glutamine methyltransferase [Crossiella equi]|uniref:Release factor glutamine methyltransferase n=1 Tax=Crossiella equi TaxID=130796 RepID=A0ABS5A549_9PSEU|nr:hypothetical protein [Crossiella equi]MBP2471709.1 release factor glutamine methyltransferase [Crossiella equi]